MMSTRWHRNVVSISFIDFYWNVSTDYYKHMLTCYEYRLWLYTAIIVQLLVLIHLFARFQQSSNGHIYTSIVLMRSVSLLVYKLFTYATNVLLIIESFINWLKIMFTPVAHFHLIFASFSLMMLWSLLLSLVGP